MGDHERPSMPELAKALTYEERPTYKAEATIHGNGRPLGLSEHLNHETYPVMTGNPFPREYERKEEPPAPNRHERRRKAALARQSGTRRRRHR
jgi:hypothetical protein